MSVRLFPTMLRLKTLRPSHESRTLVFRFHHSGVQIQMDLLVGGKQRISQLATSIAFWKMSQPTLAGSVCISPPYHLPYVAHRRFRTTTMTDRSSLCVAKFTNYVSHSVLSDRTLLSTYTRFQIIGVFFYPSPLMSLPRRSSDPRWFVRESVTLMYTHCRLTAESDHGSSRFYSLPMT